MSHRKKVIEPESAGLSEDAIAIAIGWSVLPEKSQRFFKLWIDDHVAKLCPILRPLYEATSRTAQARAERISATCSRNFRRRKGLAS